MESRLPAEIFDIVIQAFTLWPTFRPHLGVRMSKREIRSHSLVCHQWAKRCRYWAFATLRLDSRHAFDFFLHLIDTAEDIGDIPTLAECIQELDIVHTGPWAVPWFHHILRELSAHDIEIEPDRITLEIREAYVPASESPTTAATKYAPRSLSTSLPRTIPRTLFSHSILHLADLRFRSVPDLMRLIDDQADLTIIDWKRLTFDEGVVVPPARPRRRRAWYGMEAITTSEWSNVEMELRIMFLIAAEKIPANLLMPSDQWTCMTSAARALVLPSTQKIKLSLRGQDLGITFDPVDPLHMSLALLEFHIASSHHARPFELPYISTAQLWVRGKATVKELRGVDWEALEEAILGLSPTPVLEVNVEHRGDSDYAVEIFKWLLDVIPKESILKRARNTGKLKLQFAVADGKKAWNLWTYTDSRDILSATSEYTVGETKLNLSPPDVFGLMLCDEENRDQYLNDVRRRSESAHGNGK